MPNFNASFGALPYLKLKGAKVAAAAGVGFDLWVFIMV
jgi:hypothetical protein